MDPECVGGKARNNLPIEPAEEAVTGDESWKHSQTGNDLDDDVRDGECNEWRSVIADQGRHRQKQEDGRTVTGDGSPKDECGPASRKHGCVLQREEVVDDGEGEKDACQ